MMERDKPPSCPGAKAIDDRTAVPLSPGRVARDARATVGMRKGVAGGIHLPRREGGEFG